MKIENSEWVEAFLAVLFSIPISIGVTLPLKHFEQKFCQSWGVEHNVETRDKTFSVMGCQYRVGNSWARFETYIAPTPMPEKTQKDLNKDFFDTHPGYDINDF